MSRQGGGVKTGLQSYAQKEDSARDLLSDDNPKGSPVGGAFGSKEDVVDSNHLEVDEGAPKDKAGNDNRYNS